MKKTFAVLTLITVLASCKKEDQQALPQASEKPTYFRVEAVNPDGEIIYSDIKVVK